MKSLILIACLLQTARAAPQLISFKDGKVGVNILGYHAEAGLGGGANGGGLHASAGTPWGQNAAAGLGGNVNGRAGGILYAGAQATPDVGAGAVLGGDTAQGGYSGSEAYANGKVSSHTRTIAAGSTQTTHETAYYPQYPLEPAADNVNAIQKIRPPKKYHPLESYDFTQETDAARTQSPTIQQTKPVASIVFAKTINKTSFVTPRNSAERNNVAPAANIDSNANHNHHNHSANNDFITTTLAPLVLSPTPSVASPSSVSLSPSLNGYKPNGNIARGADDHHPTAIIITRDRTKLRTHNLKHRRNHQQKRIKANRQRQTSSTKVIVVKQEQQERQQQSAVDLPHQQQNTPQILLQQHQYQTKRQLIAPQPPPPPPPHDLVARPCDSLRQECKNVNKEVRSDIVQGALQIPIGILQSLQQSLANLGSH